MLKASEQQSHNVTQACALSSASKPATQHMQHWRIGKNKPDEMNLKQSENEDALLNFRLTDMMAKSASWSLYMVSSVMLSFRQVGSQDKNAQAFVFFRSFTYFEAPPKPVLLYQVSGYQV